MINKSLRLLTIILIISISFLGCEKEKPVETSRVVIGISSDIESFNPIYAFSFNEGNISELLYLSLVGYNWNGEHGTLDPFPLLAESWEWGDDSTTLTINLRDDVYWIDGVKCTSEDVAFTYDVYSDPSVQSKYFGYFQNYFTDDDEHVDVSKSFELISPQKLKINFRPGSNPSILDIDFPILPKHIYSKIERKDFPTAEANFNPVTNGPFKLAKWEKNQTIVLQANEKSFLYNPDNVTELVFKILPDYNARINQLKKGEIDILENIKTTEVKELKEIPFMDVMTIRGREFDYIGWNNIDPAAYAKGKKIVPHKLFGNSKVRIALTHAINRSEILKEYLSGYGELAVGPISPLFKDAFDKSIEQYEYNPDKTKQMLAEEGWKDENKDGVLEKGNQKFRFKIYAPTGNPRRSYTATLVKNNLKAVGIDVQIEMVEMGAFIQNLYAKKYDAWIVGWIIPIPLELKPYWFSDLDKTPLNFLSYQNKKVDSLLTLSDQKAYKKERNRLFSEAQKILHAEEPMSFLFWIDNITAYNKKIKNAVMNPLGVVHHCWNWSIKK